MAASKCALASAVGGWMLAMTAQAGSLGIGTRPSDAQIAAWNIDVAPDGKSLPPGRGTVAQGRTLYDLQCGACHGPDLQGGMGPALAGGKGTLASDKPLKTVGSYWPYATTLFDYIRRTMPLQAPQSLSADDVYALVGYILFRNDILPEDATVDAARVVEVRMPNRDGFYLDDRPDAKGSSCYSECLAAPRASMTTKTSP